MRQGLVIIAACGIAIAGLPAFPAAAGLVPGGWAEPIPVPPPQPPQPEPAAQRPLPPPLVRAPPHRRVIRRAAPVEHQPLPDGKVRF